MSTITKSNVRGAGISQSRPGSPGFDRRAWLKLIENALPIPPVTEADNDRLIAIMMEIDDRGEEGKASPEERAFSELLTIVVQDFEARNYPLPALPPHELLQGVIDQRGMAHKDLAAIVGNKGLTTEILAGRRKISPAVAKRISAALHIPIDALL